MTYDDWKTTDPRDARPEDAPYTEPCEICGSLDHCDCEPEDDQPESKDEKAE